MNYSPSRWLVPLSLSLSPSFNSRVRKTPEISNEREIEIETMDNYEKTNVPLKYVVKGKSFLIL